VSTSNEPWLDAAWQIARAALPAPPARVVEIGCGRLGGFVPMLLSGGYAAIGVDPEAPAGESYRRVEFEKLELPERVDAVIACTSLHHVADPELVVDRIAGALTSAGTLVVIEWDWASFDEPTARWCFERLARDDTPSWLHRLRDEWADSGQSWDASLRNWTHVHGVHPAQELIRLLDGRFERVHLAHGPYCFSGLAAATEADEQAAIDAGRIRATRIDYVARAVGP
jgi:SAM-dependent methyltransferase